jgi:hypothetical protein
MLVHDTLHGMYHLHDAPPYPLLAFVHRVVACQCFLCQNQLWCAVLL